MGGHTGRSRRTLPCSSAPLCRPAGLTKPPAQPIPFKPCTHARSERQRVCGAQLARAPSVRAPCTPPAGHAGAARGRAAARLRLVARCGGRAQPGPLLQGAGGPVHRAVAREADADAAAPANWVERACCGCDAPLHWPCTPASFRHHLTLPAAPSVPSGPTPAVLRCTLPLAARRRLAPLAGRRRRLQGAAGAAAAAARPTLLCRRPHQQPSPRPTYRAKTLPTRRAPQVDKTHEPNQFSWHANSSVPQAGAKEQRSYFYRDVNHPGPNGHKALAELVVGLLRRGIGEAAVGLHYTPRPLLAILPPPMQPACVGGTAAGPAGAAGACRGWSACAAVDHPQSRASRRHASRPTVQQVSGG